VLRGEPAGCSKAKSVRWTAINHPHLNAKKLLVVYSWGCRGCLFPRDVVAKSEGGGELLSGALHVAARGSRTSSRTVVKNELWVLRRSLIGTSRTVV